MNVNVDRNENISNISSLGSSHHLNASQGNSALSNDEAVFEGHSPRDGIGKFFSLSS